MNECQLRIALRPGRASDAPPRESAGYSAKWGEIRPKQHGGRGIIPPAAENPPTTAAGQRVFVVRRDDYVYLVPFVEDEHTVFLKTIIPSRKATKHYLGEESDDET